MKVLHVIRGLANSSGTTHIVVPLSEEQARQGCRVSVFHVDKGDGPPIEPDPTLVESCCFPASVPLDNPGISLGFARAIDRRIAEFDVVHIHAVWNFPTWWAMRAAGKSGVPYMVAPQGSFEPWALAQNRWGKQIYGVFTERPLLRRATWLQALSATEAEQFRRAGLCAPAVIVPNGIDPRVFVRQVPRLAERLRLAPGQQTLLFLARLHPKKGLDILLDAFARLAVARADITLVIAGHDAGSGYAAMVREWIVGRGLASRCCLIGEVKGAEKYAILGGADAFVLSSYSEGLPVAVVEAMAAGLPVVITAHCHLPEVAEWGAGYVVDADAEAVAGALAALFSDPVRARAMGERAKRLVADRFTWDVIARRLTAVYAQAHSA